MPWALASSQGTARRHIAAGEQSIDHIFHRLAAIGRGKQAPLALRHAQQGWDPSGHSEVFVQTGMVKRLRASFTHWRTSSGHGERVFGLGARLARAVSGALAHVSGLGALFFGLGTHSLGLGGDPVVALEPTCVVHGPFLMSISPMFRPWRRSCLGPGRVKAGVHEKKSVWRASCSSRARQAGPRPGRAPGASWTRTFVYTASSRCNSTL